MYMFCCDVRCNTHTTVIIIFISTSSSASKTGNCRKCLAYNMRQLYTEFMIQSGYRGRQQHIHNETLFFQFNGAKRRITYITRSEHFIFYSILGILYYLGRCNMHVCILYNITKYKNLTWAVFPNVQQRLWSFIVGASIGSNLSELWPIVSR